MGGGHTSCTDQFPGRSGDGRPRSYFTGRALALPRLAHRAREKPREQQRAIPRQRDHRQAAPASWLQAATSRHARARCIGHTARVAEARSRGGGHPTHHAQDRGAGPRRYHRAALTVTPIVNLSFLHQRRCLATRGPRGPGWEQRVRRRSRGGGGGGIRLANLIRDRLPRCAVPALTLLSPLSLLVPVHLPWRTHRHHQRRIRMARAQVVSSSPRQAAFDSTSRARAAPDTRV